MPIRPRIAAIALVACFAITSCTQSQPSTSATVRGTVTFQGQPLDHGVVVFSPDADRGNLGKPVRGEIDDAGCYSISAGAAIPAGWYRVSIVAMPREAAFPSRLGRPDMSNLIREVKPAEDNVFDFAIEVVNSR
jgi:hypothetical protein